MSDNNARTSGQLHGGGNSRQPAYDPPSSTPGISHAGAPAILQRPANLPASFHSDDGRPHGPSTLSYAQAAVSRPPGPSQYSTPTTEYKGPERTSSSAPGPGGHPALPHRLSLGQVPSHPGPQTPIQTNSYSQSIPRSIGPGPLPLGSGDEGWRAGRSDHYAGRGYHTGQNPSGTSAQQGQQRPMGVQQSSSRITEGDRGGSGHTPGPSNGVGPEYNPRRTSGPSQQPQQWQQQPPPAQQTLWGVWGKQRGKFFGLGRVFYMVDDRPANDGVDNTSSLYSHNSFGQRIQSKTRIFIVVEQDNQWCLAVPITTYSNRGVAKPLVKKSNHCIAHTGSKVPQPRPDERPVNGELPMQEKPIRVDADPGEKLDPMSRINFGSPREVPHYTEVKNFGVVHPDSLNALLSQFRNVKRKWRASRSLSNSAPVALLSNRTKYSQAYSALIGFGWSLQQAGEFVNAAVRGNGDHIAGNASTSSDETEYVTGSEGE